MAESTDNLVEEKSWPVSKKISFLFLFCYCALYIFPFPLESLSESAGPLGKLMDSPILFVGNHILHITNLARIQFTGSGDTTFDYVRVFSLLLFSIVIALLIFFIDRKRKNYRRLFLILLFILRYYVGIYMIIYGLSKVFYSQFPFPGIAKMDQTYGSSSPMGLLWTFMGYSFGYNIFSGLGETIGGLLLLNRRTVVFGALLSIFILCNVFALNMFYDVPVKLFSAHLIIFAVIILSPNIKALCSFFFLKRQEVLNSYAIPLKQKWLKVSRIIFKVLIAFFLVFIVFEIYEEKKEYSGDETSKSLYASYDIRTFIMDNDTLLPLTTDTLRWKRLTLGTTYASVVTMDDKSHYYKEVNDSANKYIELTSYSKPIMSYTFNYDLSGSKLSLTGGIDSKKIYLEGEQKDPNNYLLIKRGFHWINDYPFNR